MYSIEVKIGVNCWNVLLIHPKSVWRRWTMLGSQPTREDALKMARDIRHGVANSKLPVTHP